MNGRMMSYERYREPLAKTAPPVLPHELEPQYDIRAMLRYAKNQGKAVVELSPEEKEQFRLVSARDSQLT